MPREVTDSNGISWTCIQAYAGLNDGAENMEAGKLADGSGNVAVVCTPSGGAKSIRLELPAAWEDEMTDSQLLDMLEKEKE